MRSVIIFQYVSAILSPPCLAPHSEILDLNLSVCLTTQTTIRVIRSYGSCYYFITFFPADTPEYTRVATPKFSFKNNNFLNVDLMMLNMPGMQNVPLGDLEIVDNKVPCNCSMIKVR